jgi:DNA (cytosine-5)-methyltransferase 1
MGAKGAGFHVEWGFDFDPAAIDSYKRNFYMARCEATAAHEFVTVLTDEFKVDILHLSPPCQPFSPIHVWEGRNDEMNEATFLAVGDIVKKAKPRIVTLEKTFGLTSKIDKMPWFKNMIAMFTKLGFSVRWKVFNLADFGLPQARKRLFVFASW